MRGCLSLPPAPPMSHGALISVLAQRFDVAPCSLQADAIIDGDLDVGWRSDERTENCLWWSRILPMPVRSSSGAAASSQR